jgi:uncharacterized protein
MIPTAIISYRAHRRRGSVDETVVRAWVLPVVLGVVAGSFVAAIVSQIALKLVFAVLAAFNGVKMLSSRISWRLAADDPSRGAIFGSGVLIGLLSALMGIGGGVFGNIFLSLYGRPIHQIVGTTASLGVMIAVPGSIGYMIAGCPRRHCCRPRRSAMCPCSPRSSSRPSPCRWRRSASASRTASRRSS